MVHVVYVEHVKEGTVAAELRPEKEPKQNLTIQLPKEKIREAKILAAKRGISLSRLVVELLDRELTSRPSYQAARKRALARMKNAPNRGGLTKASRDEMHER